MLDSPNSSVFSSPTNQLHAAMSSDHLTPRRTKEMMRSPFHNTSPPKRKPLLLSTPKTDIIDTYCRCLLNTMDRGLRGQPLRTEELLRSPLHSNSMPRKVNSQLLANQLAKYRPEQRLVDYLKLLTAFKSIAKRIQQMSIQDFIDILNHLLPFAGIRIKVNKVNYIEQTVAAMQQLKYPHRINKSWLKVPVASLKNIWPLLDFLLNFATTKKD